MIKIDASDINIEISQAAKEQILLILEHDHTIQDNVFRIKIDGKGCNGFDYAIGFSTPLGDDLQYKFYLNNKELSLSIDPFTAYYCKEGIIDYILDPKENIDGFTFINHNEKNYRGKFFKNEAMTPEMDNE